MKAGEKQRFHNEIYSKNAGPEVLTTEDIVKGCEQADCLLSDEFVASAKSSPYYFDNQKDL